MDDEVREGFRCFEKRLSALEHAFLDADKRDRSEGLLELNLTLPEADIDGLHFNQQKVHAVFELKEDGKYYSRDILFNSARDTDEGTGKDILLKYLHSYDFKNCIRQQLPEEVFGESLDPDNIEITLPEENQGIKKYNGVSWWYWLRPRASYSAYFALVNGYGEAGASGASAVGGCAPAFCVAQRNG